MPPNTKCTPELQGRIAQLVQGGVTIPHAVEAAGASWNTVKEWFKPAMAEREPYASFVGAVHEARAKWAAGATMSITKASKNDWRAAAWMLEKLCPDEFTQKSKVELTGKDGERLIPMTREEALKELAVLAETDPAVAAILAREKA